MSEMEHAMRRHVVVKMPGMGDKVAASVGHVGGVMKESQLERQILDYLAHRNVVAYATHDAKHRPATMGVPDIVAVRDGHHYAIELKVGNAQCTQEQELFIARLRAAGATCIIARELSDVERYL